jgi:hypothetical protein
MAITHLLQVPQRLLHTLDVAQHPRAMAGAGGEGGLIGRLKGLWPERRAPGSCGRLLSIKGQVPGVCKGCVGYAGRWVDASRGHGDHTLLAFQGGVSRVCVLRTCSE